MTPEAAEGLIEKLTEFKKQGEDISAVLKQSVTEGWTGLFPVRANNAGNGKGKPSDLAHSAVPPSRPRPTEQKATKEEQARVKVLLHDLTEKL